MHIVAEFHAHKIRPSRIAYRVGIDIAFIEELIAGETEPRAVCAAGETLSHRALPTTPAGTQVNTGVARYEQQQQIEREFAQETDL